MSKQEKAYGEHNNDDIIRDILREYASRENPIGAKYITDRAEEKGIRIGRNAITGFSNRMGARYYETEEECDEIIKECFAEEREIIFVKTSEEGRRTKGYWMMEIISESEWMYLMDSVLYSKILTKKEADNLAKRLTVLAGKNVSDLMRYRHRMDNQPYFIGDEDIDEKIGHIESRVLQQVQLIREAIRKKKKVKFNLCVYDYADQQVRLVPYGKHGKVFPEAPEKYREDVHRTCSPFEIVFSNGRYYMLGADLETERRTDLKYKLYRVDLMTDVSITSKTATTKEEAGLRELEELFQYRMENLYMYTGKVETVRIRVDSDQFTQIVDWFSDNFKVIEYNAEEKDKYDADDSTYYDIEVKVNLNSFTFWVLQYSGCIEVLERKGDDSYRKHIKDTLKRALEKYEV